MKDNQLQSRFELEVENEIAYADYRKDGNLLHIKYVYAPPALRGTGAAGKLMKEIMETARTKNMKVNPVCGYAASWIQRHKEFHDLLDN